MFFSFNIKTRLVIAGVLFALGIFVLLQSFILDQGQVPLAHGSATDNLRGWGWSEGIGWISLNCYNDYDDNGTFDNCCPGGNSSFCSSYGGLSGGDYGVDFNTTSNKLTGWAWSDMAGWICFGETCTPPAKCEGGDNDGLACTTDADCPGGICQNRSPHGRDPWACVGRPDWSGGTLLCSGDAGESFNNTANIVSQWKMNDAISDSATSDTISTNHGTLKPTPTSDAPKQVKGKYDIGLSFDGTNDYIEVADSVDLSITGSLTVEAWVKRGAVGTEQTIVGKWDEANNQRSYRLWFDTSNNVNFSVSSNGTAVTTITQAPKCVAGSDPEETVACTVDANCAGSGVCKNKPITDVREWHHVAGKFIAGSSLRIFIDGRLAGVQTTSVPASIYDSNKPLYFGTKFGATVLDTYFNGSIDNVSVWNRAKSGNEIFDDAHMEISGWAKAISSKEGGWLSLRGFTRGDKVWGAYLKDYLGFYTLGGFIGERHNNERLSTTGLVSHWKLNEHTWDGTANEVIDGSGNNNHGTASGGVTTIDKGIFSRAGDFDGTDDEVDFGNNASLKITGNLTIEAWIKRGDALTTFQSLVTKWQTSSTKAYAMHLYNNQLYGYISKDGMATNRAYRVSSSSLTSTTDWYHVAMVYTTAPSLDIYVNGALDNGTLTTAGSWDSIYDSIDSVQIGNGGDNNNSYFKGMIDNVSIYSRAKSPTEIKADYDRKNPYSAGWGDFDDDPPAPLAFNTLSLDSSVSCSQMLVQWEPSTWAESYSYWREQQTSTTCDACTSSSECTTNGYTEYSYLSTCSATECSLSDTGLTENTGYCYTVEAHNDTGDTWITNTLPSYPAPQWKSTTLCPVSTGLIVDNTVCGQLKLVWDTVTGSDGYNTYRDLDDTKCSTGVNSTGCEAIGHTGEAMDYDADNDGTTDLVGNWKMNEGSGTTVADSSGSSNTGTATGSGGTNTAGPAVDTAGLFSNARSFDGTDDYIDLPNVLDPSTTDFTIEFWFKVGALDATNTDDQIILAQENDTTTSTGGEAWLFINDSANAGANADALESYLGGAYTDTGVAPTAGQWYHAVLTKSGTSIKIYINGELKVTGTQTVEATDGGLRIGLSKADTNPFNGVIDNVSIYNVAKTAEQIRIDYEAGDCGGADCGVDSSSTVCHQQGVADSLCGKDQSDASACCFIDKRIVPFTNYYYKLTASNEAGESLGSSTFKVCSGGATNAGVEGGVCTSDADCPSGETCIAPQTSCYPAPEAGEE